MKSKEITSLEKEFGKEFNPKEFEKLMEEAVGDGYYQDEEEKDEESEDEEEAKDEVKGEETVEKPKLKISNRDVKKALKQEAAEGNYDVWWACDNCFKPIKPGKYRFDCKICDNFTLCKQCFSDNETHAHEFKKEKIPSEYTPPKNSAQLLSKAYKICQECNKDISNENIKSKYFCSDCECFVCKACKTTHAESKGDHTLVKHTTDADSEKKDLNDD